MLSSSSEKPSVVFAAAKVLKVPAAADLGLGFEPAVFMAAKVSEVVRAAADLGLGFKAVSPERVS
jgi:hypothetical protein